MKFITLITSLLSFSAVSFGQTASEQTFHDPGHMTCSHNAVTEAYFSEHPEARIQAEQERAEFNARIRSEVAGGDREADFIIPVVFHIVHANGEENISDEQVFSAIDVLNEDFSANTPDIENVQPAFTSIVGNANVEFRLARKDPDGNCTNGINRVYNESTNSAGDNVKYGDAETWGRTKYLNIWVVANIDGNAAGYAYLPWGAPNDVDGILIENTYVGRVGTGSDTRSHALTHEAGHWAGLSHTWGDSDSPGSSTNCNDDDGLSDTPETVGWSTCDLDGESCGSLDNVENFMDYAYCYKMFTQDQAGLMGEVLQFGPAGRNLLNSTTNHSNTGILDLDVICEVDFTTVEPSVLCEGGELTFQDLSYNGATSWEWIFEGGTPSSSNIANPVVTYDNPGNFDVTLTVSNANGSLTHVENNYVKVLPFAENQLPFHEGFEGFSTLENNAQNWSVLNSDDTEIEWELKDGVAFSGNKSVYLNGRQNANNQVETLMSPTYDLTSIDSEAGEEVIISFKYAHAQRNGLSDDVLVVKVTRNCGYTWSVRKTIDMSELPTVSGNVSSEFAPGSDSDWQEVVISNVISSYNTDQFMVQFEFTSYSGNNIYIDDINLYNSNEGPLSVSSPSFASEFSLYPNPTEENAVLSYNLEKSAYIQVEILDLSGRVISNEYSGNQSSGAQRTTIQTNSLAQGVYLVRITSEGEQFVTKLVRQ